MSAEDTCLSQRSSLSSFGNVFLSLGVADEVLPPLKNTTHFGGGGGTGGRMEDDVNDEV